MTTIEDKAIRYLLDLNRKHSDEFRSPAVKIAREGYRLMHSTEICVSKCMDGRLNLSVMTGTALGIIQPWRNLGGEFNLGWAGFQHAILEWVKYSLSRQRKCLVINTYHYSQGETHRGCKGHDYNTEKARASALKLTAQFNHTFGKNDVYAITCGIETDFESLKPIGDQGEELDLTSPDLQDANDEYLLSRLHRLYPTMPKVIVEDLLPLIKGNVAHTQEIKALNRAIQDTEHNEWILGVGRGFDWLHLINAALIVGPYDPDLAIAIRTAAVLLLDNIRQGRTDKERGIVLMASAPYREEGYERVAAEEKALFLQDYTKKIITKEVPELLPYLKSIAVSVNMNTRAIEVLD